ncbi:hypothetical protein [Brachyspira alvinipulli]|uniref:hypothetical protein n=1 Tax=Brachyspira alvinipulli TaxID=84379 RepID=UPI000487EB16|nr:hypothetical protein [Brachyspira alvinipulli]
MGKYDSRYNIDLDYTDINENVFLDTMHKLDFNAYKKENTKQIFCSYKNIEFNITYENQKTIICINTKASAFASFLVEQKVFNYNDMYTRYGYFRDNPSIYNVICMHIVNLTCIELEPSIRKLSDTHWSYEFLLHHFIDYITIEYEKNLGIYKPSNTITIGLNEKAIKKLLSYEEERKKFFTYIKITDESKKIFFNDLEKIPLTQSDTAASEMNIKSKYIFTLESYFYNNGQIQVFD